MPPKRPRADAPSRFPKYFAAGFGLIMAFSSTFAILGPVDAFLGGLENLWYDTMFRMRGMREPDPRITIVEIDDWSIQRLGEWPLRRGYYGKVLDSLKKAGTKAVGFDIMFFEPSSPEEDDAFAEAIERFGNVVLGADVDVEIRQARRYRRPLELFRDRAKSLGLVNPPLLDPDGVVRKSINFFSPRAIGASSPQGIRQAIAEDPNRIPLLGVATLAAWQGKDDDWLFEEHPIVYFVNIAGEETVGEEEKRRAFRYISMYKLVRDQSDLESRVALLEEELARTSHKAIDAAFQESLRGLPQADLEALLGSPEQLEAIQEAFFAERLEGLAMAREVLDRFLEKEGIDDAELAELLVPGLGYHAPPPPGEREAWEAFRRDSMQAIMDWGDEKASAEGWSSDELQQTSMDLSFHYLAPPEYDESGEIAFKPPLSIVTLLEKSAESVWLTKAELEALDGGLVLFGSTALGAFDHFPSPFSESTPGVEVHANMVDNLLNRNYIRQPANIVMIALTLAMVGLAYYLAGLDLLVGAIVALAMTAMIYVSSYLLFLNHWRLGAVNPSLSLALTYIVLYVERALREQREKKWIRSTFAQYLSPKVIEVLQKDPEKLSLGGEKRDLAVFFLDIQHFTSISEALSAEELAAFLNKYLTALTDIILKRDGVVDKYIGDCVMAFWNAPVDVPNYKTLACISAIECQGAMEELNKTLDIKLPETPVARIGINSGEVRVGNFGSTQRFAYTVIGDEVNLASRLEGANKFFGTRVMCSEAVYEEAKDAVVARELGRVRVVGKKVPIRVYELVAKAGEATDEQKRLLDAYTRGLRAFENRDFEAAQKAFEEAQKIAPDDKPTKLYLNQCNDYILIPPPDDWENVFSLTSK